MREYYRPYRSLSIFPYRGVAGDGHPMLELCSKAFAGWENGEWYWAVLEDGSLNLDDDKAGFWKCPYHNSRMCLELIEREY